MNGGGGGGSRSQSCAACRYRRCKCSPDCPLAPYFPASHGAQFRNVHRLFGVGNITNALENLRPPERDTAAQSMMFEADARAADPVWGCSRVIFQLQYEIASASADLNFVLHQLTLRTRDHHPFPPPLLLDAHLLPPDPHHHGLDYARSTMWHPPLPAPAAISPVELQFEVIHTNDDTQQLHQHQQQLQGPVEMEDSSSSCHPPLHLPPHSALDAPAFSHLAITPPLDLPASDHPLLPRLTTTREEEEGKEAMSGGGSCTQGEDGDCSDCRFFVLPQPNDSKDAVD